MALENKGEITPVFKRMSKAASLFAILIGLLVLLGWLLNIDVLKNISPFWITLKVNAAFAFVLLGISLWLFEKEPKGPINWRQGVIYICAIIITLIGLLTVCEYLFNINLGIDNFLCRESEQAVQTTSPGRMAPATAISFLFFGVALLLFNVEMGRGKWPAQYLVFIPWIISLLAILGYFYGAKQLYQISTYTSMAFHTALTLFILSLGFFSHSLTEV